VRPIGSSEITYEWIASQPRVFKRGSLGRPVFGYEVRLVGADGQDVTQPNVAGEAWIRSRTTCFYYWRKYDKSRETFVVDWARTGDHLQFDEDGFFWFSGRANDLFKVKGLWVSPLEIEAALTRHPAIREAAVVPFTDPDGLTKPKAYLVMREGFSQNEKLLAELRAAIVPLGSYLVPRRSASLISRARHCLRSTGVRCASDTANCQPNLHLAKNSSVRRMHSSGFRFAKGDRYLRRSNNRNRLPAQAPGLQVRLQGRLSCSDRRR
jgi:acyl-CoA synthetase (AMP-forming)/AMP-acid ligase II